MPIILCSGFSEKIDAEKIKELGIRKYIEKPLYMSDVVVAVRKVLDAWKWKMNIENWYRLRVAGYSLLVKMPTSPQQSTRPFQPS